MSALIAYRSKVALATLITPSSSFTPFTCCFSTCNKKFNTLRFFSTSPPTPPPQSTLKIQEQLNNKFIDEGNKFKTCLAKEIDTIKQAKQDKDLVDDFLVLHQFEVSSNKNILSKTVDGEEIIVDFNHDKKRDSILSQDLPNVLVFEVHITKNNTTMTFLCHRDYQEKGETYEIKEIRAREGTNPEAKMLIQHLQDSTIATYKSFLYSRVPPSTPQIIDTLLNMRADEEYLAFLSLAYKLFNK